MYQTLDFHTAKGSMLTINTDSAVKTSKQHHLVVFSLDKECLLFLVPFKESMYIHIDELDV